MEMLFSSSGNFHPEVSRSFPKEPVQSPLDIHIHRGTEMERLAQSCSAQPKQNRQHHIWAFCAYFQDMVPLKYVSGMPQMQG